MSRKEVSLDNAPEKPKKPRKVISASKKTPTKLTVSVVKHLDENAVPKKVSIHRKQAGAVLSPIQLATASKLAKNEPLKKSKAQEDVVVSVPHTMSIRAREKALAILQKVTEDFDFSAEKFAYITGLALVFLGGSVALLSAGYLPGIQHQLSQVINATSTSTTLTSTIGAGTLPVPTFTIATPLPAELSGIADSVFLVTNADNVDARLYNLDTGKVTSLNLDSPTAGTFHFKVDKSRLDAGHYILAVSARALGNHSIHTFRGDNFTVPLPPPNITTITHTATSTGVSDRGDTSGNSGSTSGTSATSGGTATSTSRTTATTTATTVSTASTTLTQQRLEVKVSLTGGSISGNSIIKATAPTTAPGVTFFIRPLNTTTLSPLGSATRNTDYWYFLFNTLNEPNGDYEIIARTYINTAYITSAPVKVKIENFTAPVQPTPVPTPIPSPEHTATTTAKTTEITSIEKKIESVPLPKAPPIKTADTTARTFADVNADTAPTEQKPPLQISKETEAVFADHRDQLDELLKRYAVAMQSGNPLTIQIALHEIETAKTKIIADAQKNPDLTKEVSKLNLELTDRLDVLKGRVDTFEKLRTSSTKEDTHTDTDGDGISDFDEINLYHTDPHQADTDHDGFMDGTEIMKGFDPLSAKSQAPINYEMPQQSLGLVHEDILKVEDVKPLIKHDETGKTEEVQAEIRGKSLPNSYVTLYIFSTPVVVTVRTDQDGSFVYNFEKELADGQHEVYVAVTDNTGAIVARSNPFKFVKEAQAFTPVDTAHAETADSQSLNDLKVLNMYNVTIGLGVLALGLVLLMLGIGLRRKNDVEMIIPT